MKTINQNQEPASYLLASFANAAARFLWHRLLMAAVLVAIVSLATVSARAQCDISISPGSGSLPAGTVGVSYGPQTLTASGELGAFSFSFVGLSPAWLSLTSSGTTTARLTGTPVQATTYSFKVKAVGTNGCAATNSYTITVSCPNITLNPSAGTLPSGSVGSTYSTAITANGGVAPYAFTWTDNLPATFNISAGASSVSITGTPATTGTYTFDLTATETNGSGCGTYSNQYTLTINCATITLGSLPGGTAGQFYNSTITASGGEGSYSFVTNSGMLPPGITLSSGGTLSGTCYERNTYNFCVVATDGNGCKGTNCYSLTIGCPAITLSPGSLPSGVEGSSYSTFISENGDSIPGNFSASGLPSSLTLTTTGHLTGTLPTHGSYPFTATYTDTNGCSGSSNYTLVVSCPSFTFSPPTLNNGIVGDFQNWSISGSDGSCCGYTNKITGGMLPPGVSAVPQTAFSNNPLFLSGTPTTTGTYSFTVTFWDSFGCSASSTYSITIISCPTITVTPNTAFLGMVGNYFQANFSASGGTGPYTFSISSTAPGLSQNGTSLSGYPTTPGSYGYSATARDANGCPGGAGNFLIINSCIVPQYTNITVYTCGSCATAPFTNLVSDTCCSNVTLSYYLSTNSITTNYCFEVNTTNLVQVVATNTCGDTNAFYVTVTVLPGGGGPTIYKGNSLAVPQLQQGETFAPDTYPPLVILGEYNPSGPLPGSGLELPSGTVQDVKWYGTNANFTLYALAYIGSSSNPNEQVFRVVSSETFSNSIYYPPGTNILMATNFYVNCGDILAFSGIGPFYPNFVPGDQPSYDATYGNATNNPSYPAAYEATPPGPNQTFSVGITGDTIATYDFIPDDIFHNQGRYYAIGVDIAECGVCTSNCLSLTCPGDMTNYACNGSVAVSYAAEASDICSTNQPTVSYNPPSGSLFSLGTTPVTVTASDSVGNTDTCTFTVTVLPGNCATNCVPPPTNMVLWLPFDETSGNISANLASPPNPGTQYGHPLSLHGQYVDNSLQFQGTNYVSVPDYPGIEIGTNDFTIDAWVNFMGPRQADPTNVIVSKSSSLFGAPGYTLMLCTNKGLIFDINGNIFNENFPIVTNGWHFVAVSVSQSTGAAFFYMDGQWGGTPYFYPTALYNVFNTDPLWVASAPSVYSMPFNNFGITSWAGAVDEVEVYNRALSSNELNSIYYAGTAGKCKTSCPLQVTCPPTNIVVYSCASVPAQSLPQPFATNSCCSSYNVAYSPPGPFPPGSQTLLTYIISDCVGNTDLCQSVVYIAPGTNCGPCLQVTCPPTNVVVTSCTNIPAAALPQPLVSNVCCSINPIAYSPPGPFAPNTTTLVTYFVSDSCGDTDICQSVVTVLSGNCGTNNCPGVSFVNFATNAVAGGGMNLNGNAAAGVIDAEGNVVLRLTPALSFQAGSAFVPVQLGDNLSFSTEFAFQMTNGIGGEGDGTTNPPGADGICFVLANAPTDIGLLGGSGGNVGYAGIPSSVVIKFDTWDDSTASGFLQQNDPNGNFVAVYTDGSVNTAGYGLYSPLNSATEPQYYMPGAPMKNGDIWYAWINYNGANSELDVYLSDGSSVRPATPQLVQNISLDNLSYLGLSPNLFAGFTSGTGAGWDDNDVLSWNLTSPCSNACLSIACSNIVAYTCGTNCLTVPFTATAIDPCCGNSNVFLQYYVLQGTNSIPIADPPSYCFPADSTNTVKVVASDNCSNVVTSYFNVTVLNGPGSVAISYQYVGNNVILTWSQGILQASPTLYSLANNQSVEGPYSDVPGATSPYITKAVGSTTFYRLRCPCVTCSNCIVLNCPTNVTVTTCSNCTSIALGNYVGFEDNCCTNWYPLAFNYPSNFCFAVNTTYTVSVTATDYCGNAASSSFTLTVLPCSTNTNCVSLNCPGDIYVGTCSNQPVYVDESATMSGCTNDVVLYYFYTVNGGAGYSTVLSAIPFPVGVNQVTASAIQDGGNTLASCNFLVVVTNMNCGASGPLVQWTFGVSQPEATLAAGAPLANISSELGSGTASAVHQGATTYSSPTGNGSGHSLAANNWAVGDYFQFACSTLNASDISVAWDQVSSATGPALFQLEYSTDGTTFNNYGAPYVVGANGSLSGPLGHWSSISNNIATHYEQNLSSVAALNNATTVWFRLAEAYNPDPSNSATGGPVGPYGTSRVGNFTVYGGSLAGTGGIPEVTWADPAPIIYGVPLGDDQLDAMATVAGTFTYSPSNGTVLPAGSSFLSANFTPTFAGYGTTDIVSQLVVPRTLTLSADNATWVAGDTNPVFTGTVLGALNSDNVSVTWTSSSTPGSPPGQYAITPGTITANEGALSNYNIIVIPGTGTTTSNDCGCVYSNLLWWTFEVSQPSGSESAGVPITGIYPEYGFGMASAWHQEAAVYTHPSGNGSTNSFSSTNWVAGDYYQFACSNISLCGNLSAAWDQVSSATGPGTFQLQYSLDGANFVNFGQPYHVNENGQLQGPAPYWNYATRNYTTHYIQNLNPISEEPGLVATIWIRLMDTNQIMIGTNWSTVGWNPSADGNHVGPGGSSRVDNFMLNGTRY